MIWNKETEVTRYDWSKIYSIPLSVQKNLNITGSSFNYYIGFYMYQQMLLT